MVYQESLPKVWFASHVNSLLTIRHRHWQKLAATFEKAELANSLLFVWYRVPIFWGAYKHQWLFVIKMGVYIHGVLILCGCLLFQFYGITVLAQEDHIEVPL